MALIRMSDDEELNLEMQSKLYYNCY